VLLAEGIVLAYVLRVLGEQLALILYRNLSRLRQRRGWQEQARGWLGAINHHRNGGAATG
jgi:hypothetical protein